MTLVLQNCKTFYRGKIRQVDIEVDEGKISKVCKKGKGFENINCKGLFVFPGLIDVHVHFRVPGHEHKEDWNSASAAALHGGYTCVLDMPNNNPPIIDERTLDKKMKIVRRKAFVDYGLYIGASKASRDFSISLAKKIAGIKLYMSSAQGELLVTDERIKRKAFEKAALLKKTIAVHAEDEKEICKMKERFRGFSIREHHLIRNDKSESIAIENAAKLAEITGAFLHVCHVSSKLGLEKLEPMLKAGKASCGVTPHHLFLTEKNVAHIGNMAKANPSIKTEEDRKALWLALNSGLVKIIESDHAPHSLSEKNLDYDSAPAGIAGIETTLPLLLDAYNKGLISLKKILDCCCTNPSKIFGIKRKGAIEVGNDADFCIVDLHKKHKIRNDELFTKCGWSVFEGKNVKGAVEMTIIRGVVSYANGSIVEQTKGVNLFGGD